MPEDGTKLPHEHERDSLTIVILRECT